MPRRYADIAYATRYDTYAVLPLDAAISLPRFFATRCFVSYYAITLMPFRQHGAISPILRHFSPPRCRCAAIFDNSEICFRCCHAMLS